MHTNLYIILGIPKSGRREVIYDLIEGGLQEDETKLVYIEKGEDASTFDEQIASLSNCKVLEWTFAESLQAPSPAPEADTVFFMTAGYIDPIDQIEQIRQWQKDHTLELARVLTVIHCQHAHAQPELKEWFRACVHFSDCVLFNRREGIPDKWIREFSKYYQDQHFPCLFKNVKKSKVANPPEILHPEPRRVSQLFDDVDAIDALEIDEDDLPEETFELKPPTDPYLERYDSGQRKKKIPDICSILARIAH